VERPAAVSRRRRRQISKNIIAPPAPPAESPSETSAIPSFTDKSHGSLETELEAHPVGSTVNDLPSETALLQGHKLPGLELHRPPIPYSIVLEAVDLPYPSSQLCSRSVLETLARDYLELLYPLMPISHRPTFLKDLTEQRDLTDWDFSMLLVAMCAVLVATLPRKFQEYRSSLPFQTRSHVVNFCNNLLLSIRGPEYFEIITLQKWAVSYLLYHAHFHVGQFNRARMLEVEAMQLARLLDLHYLPAYDGLNCIETQLRKKAFWLMFYGHV
jgi:hypothetical protein